MERRSQRQSHLPYRPYQSRQSPPSPYARHHHHSPPSLHHSPPPPQRLSPVQPLSLAFRMYLRGRDPLKDLQWNKDWFSYLLEENQILRDAILHLYANANLSLDLPLPPMSLAPSAPLPSLTPLSIHSRCEESNPLPESVFLREKMMEWNFAGHLSQGWFMTHLAIAFLLGKYHQTVMHNP